MICLDWWVWIPIVGFANFNYWTHCSLFCVSVIQSTLRFLSISFCYVYLKFVGLILLCFPVWVLSLWSAIFCIFSCCHWLKRKAQKLGWGKLPQSVIIFIRLISSWGYTTSGGSEEECFHLPCLSTKIPTPNFRDQSQIIKIGGPRSFICIFNLACILFVLFLFGLGLGYFVSPSIDYISLFEFCFLSHLVNLTSLLRLIFRAL